MLQEAIIELPFSGGVDESTAPEHVAPGSFLSLENAWQNEGGAIQRRPGTGYYANTCQQVGVMGAVVPEGSAAAAKKCFVYNGKLYKLTDRGFIYVKSEEDRPWTWIDHAPEAVVKRRSIDIAPYQGVVCGTASHHNLVCTVSCQEDGAGTYNILGCITDLDTGSVVYQFTVTTLQSKPAVKVIAYDSTFAIIYYHAVDQDFLAYFIIGGGSSTFSTGSAILDSATNCVSFDAAPIEGATSGSRFVVAWVDDLATNAARVAKYTGVGASGGSVVTSSFIPLITPGTQDISGIGVRAVLSDNRVCFAFATATKIAICVVNLTTMVMVNETDAYAHAAVGRRFAFAANGSTYWTLIWDERARDVSTLLVWYQTKYAYFSLTTAAMLGSSPFVYVVNRAQLISKVLTHNGRCYVVVNCFDAKPEDDSRLPFYSYALLDLHTGTFTGRDNFDNVAGGEGTCIARLVAQFSMDEALPRDIPATFLGTGTTDSWFCLLEWVALSNGTKYLWVAPTFSDIVVSDASYSGEVINRYKTDNQLFEFDFDDPAINMTVEYGGVCLMTGGVLSVLDGITCGEAGFVHPPVFSDDPTHTADGVGSIAETGAHDYIGLFSRDDTIGNRYLSMPSSSNSVTLGGGTSPQNVTFAISNLSVTNWNDRFNQFGPFNQQRVYRRTGSNAYRELKDPTSPQLPAQVSRSTSDTTYIDATPSASLADNPQIYSTGSAEEVLAHDPPPSCRFIEVWGNRVWLAGCEKGRELWPSNEYVQGEGVSFSSLTVITIEDEGGDISGIKAMDDCLVIFKEDRIYRMYGEGANDMGAGATLTRPSLISAEYGCVAGHCLLLTKHGIWFLSKRGLCLLNRQFQVEHVGSPYETTINSFDRMTGAIAMPGTDLILLGFHSTEQSSYGATVTYDTANNTWGKWTIGTVNRGPTSFCVFNDKVHFVDELNGAVKYYDITKTIDEGLDVDDVVYDATFATVIETPWYTTGTKMAWQRVRRLLLTGRYLDAHQIKVEVGYDFNTPYTHEVTFPSSVIENDGLNRNYVVTWALPKQVCSAVRFRITMEADPLVLDGDGDPEQTQQGLLLALRLEIAKKPQRSRKLPADAMR